MPFTPWFAIVGGLLIAMALAGSFVKRMPFSTAILYLVVGFALGAHGLKLFHVDPFASSALLERLTETTVLISLFTAGLKLSASLDDSRWKLPLRLAFVSMLITVGLTVLAGVTLLGLPLGVAILLGGILAPTDPVLASDVQVAHAEDRDRLRFALTGEAGLNDATAFPIVFLGLGLLGLHPLGASGWRWLVVDVLWAFIGGIVIGAAIGTAVARVVIYLRTRHKEALGLDEFLTLGLIAFSYGIALAAHASGFLAVFSAGVALRRFERRFASKSPPPPSELVLAASEASLEALATAPEKAPAYMARAVLGFNEQLERLGELSLVLIIAGTLTLDYVPRAALWFVPLLLLAIRPVSIGLGTIGARATNAQRMLLAWFGIRGIGSVYYLMFSINRGLAEPYAHLLTGLTLTTIAASIIVHGISVTPLMAYYARMNRYVRRRSMV